MTYSFKTKLMTAAAYPDERFATLQLVSDTFFNKVEPSKRGEVITGALSCGAAVAKRLSLDYGLELPGKLAHLLGICVIEDEIPGLFPVLSTIDAHRKLIRLNRDALMGLERAVCAYGIGSLFGSMAVAEIVIAHELFHYIEDQDSTLFPQEYRINLWQIGPFQYRTTLPSASEIAANACAKALCGLSYNPLLLEAVLLSATAPGQALLWLDRLARVCIE